MDTPNEPKINERDLWEELYTTRLLVFIETAPQSNKYRQVMLNPEEFKKMSFSIGHTVEILPNGDQRTEANFSNDTYDIPDVPQIYYPKQ